MRDPSPALTIALLHPELWFGGAERLMLDATIELTRRGHRVALFTSRYDEARTFRDVSDGRIDVRLRVSWIPLEIAQRARVPFAVLKMAGLAAAARRELGPIDATVCDLVPQAVPLVRRLTGAPVVFYCHYPDSLLSSPGGSVYRAYRRGIDALERRGLRACARVLANSRYTLGRLRGVATDLDDVPCEVVAPGVDIEPFSRIPSLPPDWAAATEIVILAIGRFHPDKNYPLALAAFAALLRLLPVSVAARLRLVIAGGLDAALAEQRDVVDGLRGSIAVHRLEGHVTLVVSPSDEQRMEWLARSAIVLHTAPAEHFGIVPVEGMAAGRPVVAIDHAGPAETVRSGETGVLCAATPDAVAGALAGLVADAAAAAAMGERGRRHAAASFGREAFGRRLEMAIREVVDRPRSA